MNIKLEDVTKYYYDQGKSTKGLEGINLSFDTDGSFVVITGESGAGKTTLIKILTGVEDFDEGEIYFNDKPLSGISDDERRALYARYVTFVFQDYNLVESISAIDNVVFALLKHGYDVKEAKKKAIEALEKVGLSRQKRMKTSKMSGGERQRVAIARSLALDVPVIIFDEPTGNLDPNTSKEIVNLIKEVAKEKLVLYVTHDYDLVKDYATRHIVLGDGRLLSDVILKESASNKKETEEVKVPKMKASSYFYVAKSFAFSRLGRLLSTCIVLVLSVVMIFNDSYSGTFSFVSASSSSSGSNNVGEVYSLSGNVTSIKKENVSDDESYLNDYQENTDYLRDNGGFLLNSKFALFEESSFEEAVKRSEKTALNDSSSLSSNVTYGLVDGVFNISKLITNYGLGVSITEPSNQTRVYKASVSLLEGYHSIKLFVYDGGGFSYSKMKERLEGADEESPLGKKGYLHTNAVANFGGKFDDDESSFLLNGVKVYVSEVVITTDKSYSSDSGAIVGDFNFFNGVKKYLQEALSTSKSEDHADIPFWSNIYAGNYVDSFLGYPTSKSVKFFDEAGNEFTNSWTGATLYTSEEFSYHALILPLEMANDPTKGYIVWSSLKISYEVLKEVDPLLTIEYYSTSDVSPVGINSVSNGFSYNLATLVEVLMKKGGVDAFHFKDDVSAKEFASDVSKKAKLVSYLPSQNSSKTSYNVIDFSKATLVTKIASLTVLITMILMLWIASNIIRMILTKFYYRKDYDQFVLEWIGYSKHDMFLTNLIQFMVIDLISMIVMYPIMFVTTDGAAMMFVVFPWMFLLGIVLGLLFAFSLSIPKASRKKVQK